MAWAQAPALYFEKIHTQHGLSHNKVNCILQDRRGFIWLGTDDGLNRYDGKRFVHFRNRPDDTTTLTGNIITDLHEDREGRLWIATADGGLSRYDYRLPPDRQFRQYRHRPGDGRSLPVNAINALLEDGKGDLWLGTSGRSLIRFRKRTETFDDITRSSKTILDLCLDRDGLIWVGRQGGGLLKLNPSTLTTFEDQRYRDLYAQLPHVTITALFRDRDDHIWFGSWDKILYQVNAFTGKETGFRNTGPYAFADDEILCFAEDPAGRIWMGGKEKGLHLYDKRTGRFYRYGHDPAQEGTVSDNRINCLYIDRQGRTWIGTNRGVSINNPQKQQFVQQFLPAPRNTPLTVFDFHELENGSLLIGTSAGLYIQGPDGSLQHRALSYKGTPLQVSAFYRDEDGTLYLGTNLSLFRYDLARGTLSLLPNTDRDGVMSRIIESRVVSVVRSRIRGHDVLLVAPYGHFMAYYDLVARRWVSRLDSSNIVQGFNLRDNLIRKFHRARNGSVWMATAKQGLAVWRGGEQPRWQYFDEGGRQPLTNSNVSDLAEDDRGNLWVSTYGGGLHYLDVRTRRFTAIPASNNLTEGLALDHHGQVWTISNGSVHKYDPRRKAYTSYYLPDLEKTGGVRGRIFKDRHGRLYVAGTNYFIRFHPDSLTESRSDPKVSLTDFQIFNRSYSHLLQQPEIRLSHKENHFAFEFAAPEFTSGSSVRYSYMLEGFDKDWVDAGERNYVAYSNLEGESYVFRVRATNAPGTWTGGTAAVRITVIPPYWKRPWFYATCALVLALLSWGLYRYRINELLKRQAIRNKIAQDLHDNVGSTLSSISVYSQVARIYHGQHKTAELDTALEKISATSSEMISELNDTVWAINPRNDNMEVILQRMESFSRPLLATREIGFRLDYDRQLPLINLEMEQRKNFYLIYKEAVNNILKYADCRQVAVEVRQKGRSIILRIQDDGRGFDLSKTSEGYKSSDVYGGGNGLKNMQLRAREMKGSLQISSAPGKGTTVHLTFPIT
jgi:ligand-binding sensor domain-containing protein/two-component sensor histidine kinase